MNLFRFFRKKPVQQISAADAVRRALHVCVDDVKPPLTKDEFESLYCAIFENEMYRQCDAGEIINAFLHQRKAL